MDRATEIKIGLAVVALGAGYAIFARKSAPSAITVGPSAANTAAAEQIAIAQLQARVALAQNATGYLGTLDKDKTQLGIADVQGRTAVQLGDQALQAAQAQYASQTSVGIANANAAQYIGYAQAQAQTNAANAAKDAQISAAGAAASASKTNSWLNFLGGILNFFKPAPGSSADTNNAFSSTPTYISGLPTFASG